MKNNGDASRFQAFATLFALPATLLACGGGSRADAVAASATGGVAGAAFAPGPGGTNGGERGEPSSGGAVGSGGLPGSGGTGSADTGGTGGALAGGGSPSMGGAAGGAGREPCTITPDAAMCDSEPVVSLTNGMDTRRVYWNTPRGKAPESGWPAAVLYQGSIYGPSLSWNTSLPKSTSFGGYYQVLLIDRLLSSGFVVVQPEAPGGIAWNTNNGGNYDTSADSVFIPDLLNEIAAGTFGKVDMTHLYATGISSGGYMTSRMAVSYPGRFRALAIESGSYATCVGPICAIPATLPADHPPTLFLHGDADTIVPVATAKAYAAALSSSGIETKFVEDPTATHQWLPVAPDEVTNWFESH